MAKKNKIKNGKTPVAPDYDGEGRNKSLLGKNAFLHQSYRRYSH